MDANQHKNIAFVLYSSGLDYDDRIRKEMLTIQNIYTNIHFKIFALVPDNKSQAGITNYGVPFEIPYLSCRDRYKAGQHKLIKAWGFYKNIKNKIANFDAVWCADVETFMFLLLLHKPMVWDLHELPLLFMKNPITKLLFKHIIKRCKVVIHANSERIDYLLENKMIINKSKHLYLRNFSSFQNGIEEIDKTFCEFCEWKGDSLCVYLQGLSNESRAPYESVSAVLKTPKLKAVVLGWFDENAMQRLKQEYGDRLNERVFFTGMIKQLNTPQYIKECMLSLVFYKNTSPNNYYCEPNRLFQNIVNGNPVVVGCNPPMKDLVDKYKFGESIDDDGGDINKIILGIQKVLDNYEQYLMNIEKNKFILNWELQIDTHKQIIEALFN